MYRKSVLFLSFIFFITNIIFSSDLPQGISFEQNGTSIKINFELENFSFDKKNVEGKEFIKINAGKDYGSKTDYGTPLLPTLSFNIVLPENRNLPEIINIKKNEGVINLDSKIYPAQAPWPKSEPIEKRPFTINDAYYLTEGTINNSIVSFSEEFNIAGVRGITVTIHPFLYNPVEDKLLIVENAVIDIDLKSELNNFRRLSSNFNSYLNNIFINYTGSEKSKGINYTIITAPEYESGLTPFVESKTAHGYNVSLYNTGATGTTTTSIKTFIQGLYNDVNTKPEYILLVGDIDKIPAWTGSGNGTPTTDLYYTLLEGDDSFADLFIGRFSVTNAAELNNIIQKSIYMENHIGVLDKKNVFMASTDNSNITEGTHDYVISNYFEPDGYTNLKLYTVTYNATTSQLINALNDNQQFAIYSGHGSTTGWADGPQLSQSQVRALTNSVFPFVYSFACVTGSYHLSECFAETWVRAENGASTFYGSSVNSYWDEDDVLEKEIFKCMFVDNITKVTPMFEQAKVAFITHYGGSAPNGSDLLRYLEMYNLMGDPSLPTKMQIPPDSTAPEAITDLNVTGQTSESITLNWTAPFDSTISGITSYDIRYSENPITNDADFNSAAQVMYSGNSDTAGTEKNYLIEGLGFSTEYYFAVKALDVWSNASEISNSVSGTTYEAPVISVNPAAVSSALIPNATVTDTLIISNISTGNSTLNYSVELTNHLFPGDASLKIIPVSVKNKITEAAVKGAEENSEGSIKGSGGPDNFGYEWIDSNDPSGPQYIWNDISTTGTEITSWNPTGTFSAEDEGVSGPIEIGFPFKFYGEEKNEVYVSTNGVISFVPITTNIFSNKSIPETDEPNNFIAAFWDDLKAGANGKVYHHLDGNKFIVQFTNWEPYSGSGTFTFQVVLKRSQIFVYYKTMGSAVDKSTLGIENSDGTDGLQVVKNAAYLSDNMALQFAAEPEWLAINDPGGTIYNGNSVAVEIQMACADLPGGSYSMDFVITSNDPANSSIVVPISMEASGVIPVELTDFSAIENDGNILLNWETKTETNNSGFEIERKQIKEKSWQEISFVEGNGTTAEESKYSFSDKPAAPGKYEYRLKQLDFDGTFAYSKVLTVEFNAPDKYELSQNYPNPFNPSTKIKFSLPEAGMVNLSVYNLLGEKVSELINKEMEIGYHEVEFTSLNMATGIYLFRITAGDFVSVKKMMLMK